MIRCLPINACGECPHKRWDGPHMKFYCDNSLHPHMLADVKSKIDLTKEVSPECPLDVVFPKKGLPPPTEGQRFRTN